jgi:hypothetical protein
MDKPIGVDISYYEVKWGQTLTGQYWKPENSIKPIDFVIQRSSYGSTEDKCIDFLYEKSTRQIPVIGFYHYFSSWDNYKKQIEVMLKAVEDKPYHFLAVDYEGYGNTLDHTTFAGMCEMVKQLKTITGKKVLTYFNPSIYNEFMKPFGADKVIKTWDIWYAQYPYMTNWDKYVFPKTFNGANVLLNQAGGGDCANTIGIVSGPDYGSWRKGIDLNVWHSTLEELHTFFGFNPDTTTPTPDTIPIPTEPPIVVVTDPNIVTTIFGLNIRTDSSITANKVGFLGAGTKVTILEYRKISETEIWAKIVNGWIALKFGGSVYTSKSDFTSIPIYVPEIVVPPVVTENVLKITAPYGMNVRSGAGTLNPVVGNVSLNDYITILEYKRLSPTEVWGRSNIGWIALQIGTTFYTDKKDFSNVPLLIVIDPPVVVIPVSKSGTVIISVLNIRTNPSTTSSIAGTLRLNDKVLVMVEFIDSMKNVWGKIRENQWICMIYQGTVYIKYDSLIEIVPPIPPSSTVEFVKTFKTPATGVYYQALHDYENGQWGYVPRSITMNYKDGYYSALPETVPLLNKKEQFFPLSEEWQFFWYDLLKLAAGNQFSDEELIKRWASLTADSRAWTDNRAVQNGYCDFVQKINMGAKPIAIKSLMSGGNFVKVLSTSGRLLTIECLNFSKSPPDVNDVWNNKRWLFHFATQETIVKLADKTYITLPFPQLKPINGSPVPIGSLDGTQIISKDYCKILENNKTYNINNG